MSKTKEELNELKKEVESVNEKLNELTPEELEQIAGGGSEFIEHKDSGGSCVPVEIWN